MTYAINMDTVIRPTHTLESELAELRTEHWTASFEVLTEHGPAGGWPVIRITAPTRRQLEAVLVDSYGFDQGELDEYAALIEEI